jgi:RNA polymerase sigma-70 factor (ECF subfamily)
MPRDPLANPEQLIHRVYGYARYRVPTREDAEDVTSETFERALRYRDSFDPTKGEPVAWLIGIARRCIAARAGAPDSPLDEAPEAALLGDLATEVAERVDLMRALATLSERDRELIALRYGADLKARDIGRLLELRPNAVEVALHRSLQRLRRFLEQEPVRKPAALPVPIADRLSTYRKQGEPS